MVSHLKVSSNEVYLNYADIFSHFALELPEWGYQILILHKLSLDFLSFNLRNWTKCLKENGQFMVLCAKSGLYACNQLQIITRSLWANRF